MIKIKKKKKKKRGGWPIWGGRGWFGHPMAEKIIKIIKNCWVLALGGGRTTPMGKPSIFF